VAAVDVSVHVNLSTTGLAAAGTIKVNSPLLSTTASLWARVLRVTAIIMTA